MFLLSALTVLLFTFLLLLLYRFPVKSSLRKARWGRTVLKCPMRVLSIRRLTEHDILPVEFLPCDGYQGVVHARRE